MMICFDNLFGRTLHKIYIYIEAQQDGNKFKQLFRNIEMNKLVKDCHAELDEAKKIFEVSPTIRYLAKIEHIISGWHWWCNLQEH